MTAEYIDQASGAPFVEIQNLPDSVPDYLLPGRYCESDCFHQVASEITAGQMPGYDQIAAIVRWLQDTINYSPGSSAIPASAAEVNSRQVDVCRDLVYLCIVLCRSLGIPARMVVGFLHQLEPTDLHAWFEACVGGRWYIPDVTQVDLKGGYVAVGNGRDAANVAVFNQFGPAVYPTAQTVRVERIRG
jgi:transglutaminase-like putative cysteine protease